MPGIDLPESQAAMIKERITAATSALTGHKRILSFACRGSSLTDQLQAAGEAFVEVECMGQIPPSFIDFCLSRSFADGVFLAACSGSACHYRLGTERTQQRIERERDPRLRKRVDERRIAAAWRDYPEYTGRVIDQINAFRKTLPESVPVEQEAAA